MAQINIEKTLEKIIHNTKTKEEKAKAVFYFVRDEIKFDVYVGDFFISAEEVLEIREGSCVTKATLMVEMMRLVDIPARYHFVLIKREGLKDIIHPFVYKFWPEEFIHIYPDIKLINKWIDFDATYDKKFHDKLIKNHLNFGNDKNKIGLNIDFSINGVKSAQDLYLIEDKGYGDNLNKLRDSLKTLPAIKRGLMPFARWLSRRQVKKIRRLL